MAISNDTVTKIYTVPHHTLTNHLCKYQVNPLEHLEGLYVFGGRGRTRTDAGGRGRTRTDADGTLADADADGPFDFFIYFLRGRQLPIGII